MGASASIAAGSLEDSIDLIVTERLQTYKDLLKGLDTAFFQLFAPEYIERNADGGSVLDYQSILAHPTASLWLLRLVTTIASADSTEVIKHCRGDDNALEILEYSDEEAVRLPQKDFCLIAESGGLSDITGCMPFLLKSSEHGNCMVFNISNNAIPDDILQQHKGTIANSVVKAAMIGGNPITNCKRLCSIMPTTLLSLDLSYTEGIQFTAGCFRQCFQLYRLVLDGCNITSTVCPEKDSSIFDGLVSLVDLSLKENCFADTASLRGILVLGYKDIAPLLDEKIALDYFGDSSYAMCSASLRNLWIAENPLCETSAKYKAAVFELSSNIPSLQLIDDKAMTTKAAPQVKYEVLKSKLSRQVDAAGYASAGLSQSGLDNMEQEYLAALKGEKDTTAVS